MHKLRPFHLVLAAAIYIGAFLGLTAAFSPQVAIAAFISVNLFCYSLQNHAILGVNTLGTLAGSLVLQKALELTFVKRPALKFFSIGLKDLDGKAAAANLNQSVITRTRTIPAIGNLGDAAAAMTTTDVPVSLTAIKQCLVTMTATEANSTDRNLIDEAAEPMAKALTQHIIDAAAAIVTSRNFSRQVAVASGWTYDNTIRALRKNLNVAGVPRGPDRYFLGNADVDDELLGDSKIIAAFNNPLNQNAIATGVLPGVGGMQYDDYAAMPTNNGTAVTGVTAVAATDLISTLAAHGLQAGDPIVFSALTGGAGITPTTVVYYVIASGLTATDFKVSTTRGGATIDITSNMTAGTITLSENLCGFAGVPNAVVAAIRPPKNPEELLPGAKFPGVLGYVTEPISGATFMINQWIGTDLTLNSRFVWLEGFQKGDVTNLTRLVTA